VTALRDRSESVNQLRRFFFPSAERLMVAQQHDLLAGRAVDVLFDPLRLQRGEPAELAFQSFDGVRGIKAENQPVVVLEREIAAALLAFEASIAFEKIGGRRFASTAWLPRAI